MKEIDLQIRESSITGYTVSLLSGGEKLAEVFLRHSDEIRRLPAMLRAAVGGGTTAKEVIGLANRFYAQVFQEPIEIAFKSARESGPVRLRIRAEPPEMARVPWEILAAGEKPISLSPDIAFSRLPMDATGFKPAPMADELSILVASAESGGSAEIEAFEEALSGLSGQGLVQVTSLRSASLATIRSALDAGQFRAIAIVAGGPLGTDRATGYLQLLGDGGGVREHNVTELAPLLYGHRGVRFLLLSAGCAHEDWIGDSYESLIRLCFGMKVSGALALVSRMNKTAYVGFLRTFFEEAMGGKPIDVAAGEARRAIQERDTLEYAIPILYAGDPFCLKVSGASETAEPGPPMEEQTTSPDSFLPQFPTTPVPVMDLEAADLEEEALEEEDELQEMVKGFVEEGDKMNEAAALDRLGRCQAKRGRARKAIVSYQRALEILRAKEKAGDALAVMLHLGQAFERAQEPERALQTYEEQLFLAERLGDEKRAAAALMHIGEMQRVAGSHEEAILTWRTAVERWQSAGKDGRAADLLARIGAVLQGQDEYNKAEVAYESSLEIHRARDDRIGMATALNNLGNVTLRKKGRDQAVSRYLESLDLFRQTGNQEGIASVCHNLANISLRLGEFDKALKLSKEALTISQSLGLSSLAASSEKLRARLRSQMGEEAFRNLDG
ncbi:MAG: tetratricopeptide repeat protein [Planctomycetota bacterium]|nr:tetratricopeptide repeat protein [Planctomycetota bacterium]